MRNWLADRLWIGRGRERRAARWFAALRGVPDPAGDAAFARWCEADPRNRAAYDALVRDWERLEEVSAAPRMQALRRATLRETAGMAGRERALSKRLVPIAVTLLVAVSVGVFLFLDGRGDQVSGTEIGEIRTIALADGSHITLDTDSRVRVAYAGAERKVVLERGQAQFQVAPDKTRPFRVEAAGGAIVALGTRFDVRLRDADEVVVTLIEGTVAVSEPGTVSRSGAHEATKLDAGEQISFSRAGLSAVRRVPLDKVTAWQTGYLVFDDTPLIEVIAEANRYARVRIRLGDAQLRERRVSGAFKTGQTDTMTRGLARSMGLRIGHDPDGTIVLFAS